VRSQQYVLEAFSITLYQVRLVIEYCY